MEGAPARAGVGTQDRYGRSIRIAFCSFTVSFSASRPSFPRTRRWSSVNSLKRTMDGAGSPALLRSVIETSSGHGVAS